MERDGLEFKGKILMGSKWSDPVGLWEPDT